MLDKKLLELKPATQQEDRGSGSHRKKTKSIYSQPSRAAINDNRQFSSAGNLIPSGKDFQPDCK